VLRLVQYFLTAIILGAACLVSFRVEAAAFLEAFKNIYFHINKYIYFEVIKNFTVLKTTKNH